MSLFYFIITIRIITIIMAFVFLQLSLLEYDDDGILDQTSIIPVVDGGTEGKKLTTKQ